MQRFVVVHNTYSAEGRGLISQTSDQKRTLVNQTNLYFYFRWMHRQRIKITLTGEHATEQPVELHDQQLQYPEYRFLDCVEGQQTKNSPKVPKLEPKHTHELPVRALNEVFIGESLSSR